jgi:hypothetical protein
MPGWKIDLVPSNPYYNAFRQMSKVGYEPLEGIGRKSVKSASLNIHRLDMPLRIGSAEVSGMLSGEYLGKAGLEGRGKGALKCLSVQNRHPF